ncbi:SIS domain-containing protein [Candidatus Pacearchaeota archaeon]|nr:SIS domain-containing protein [Candidatus Pacearchaeota archaeon]
METIITKDTITRHVEDLKILVNKTSELHKDTIIKIAELIINSYRNDGKIIIFGNGGSYADSLHFAAELEGCYRNKNRSSLKAMVPSNPSTITAISNDFSYKEIFLRFIKANADKRDIVIALSTSGNSENVILALEEAKNLGAITVGFTGETGGKMKLFCDILFNVPSQDTPRIQEIHHFAYHEICEIVEKEMFG